MRMPYQRAIKLIERALEKETEEFYYRLWLARYPNYTPETYETFQEFYDKARPKKIEYDMRDKDELMSEILGN